MEKNQFLIPKILGVFLAFSVITACPELPEFKINTVDLGGLRPVFGEEPPENLGISNNAAYYMMGTIKWTPPTDSFEAGDYTAAFTLLAREGFVFSGTVEVKNPDGKVKPGPYPGSIEVSVTFTVKENEDISGGSGELDLTYLVPLPFIGGSPAETINLKQFSGTITWDPPVGPREVFKQDTQYKATVTLTAKTGYTFRDVDNYTYTHRDAADPPTSGEVSERKVTVTITFPKIEQQGWSTGQDYIVVAGGEYDNIKSRYIYLFFKEPVTLITRQQVYIRGATVPSAEASDPEAAPAYDGYGDKVWRIPLPSGIRAGSASFEIRGNDAVSSVLKSVLIHGDSPSPNPSVIGINPADLSITRPAAGGDPQPSVDVDDGTGYTGGDIDWWYEDAGVKRKLAAGDKFEYGAVYKAEFALTVLGDYRFLTTTSWTCNGVPVESEVPDRIGNASEWIHGRRIITAVFQETDPATRINIAAVGGVTAPATGGTPATAITPTAQYTGTVSWDPAVAPGGTFAASTQYTATITLSPLAGYTLTGVVANFFTVAGTSTPATNNASSGVITAVFPETGPASTSGATITFTVTDVGGTVTITPSGATSITKPNGTLTLTVNIPAGSGITVSNWRVDGDDKGAGTQLVINAADYGIGGHSVILTIEKSGVPYSATTAFTVN